MDVHHSREILDFPFQSFHFPCESILKAWHEALSTMDQFSLLRILIYIEYSRKSCKGEQDFGQKLVASIAEPLTYTRSTLARDYAISWHWLIYYRHFYEPITSLNPLRV